MQISSSQNRSSYLLHIVMVISGGLMLRYLYGFQESILFWLGLFLSISSVALILRHIFSSRAIRHWLSAIYILLALIIIIVSNLHLQNESNYGAFISESMIAVFQSNPSEMLSYISQFGSVKLVYVCLIWGLLFLSSYYYVLRSSQSKQTSRDVVLVSTLLVLLSAGVSISINNSSVIRMVVAEAVSYSEVLNKFAASRSEINKQLAEKNIRSDFEGNLVVVIGESTSRHHMSVYDYFRNTTPRMKSMADDLFIFRDIISTHSHTTESLSDVLVLNNRTGRQNVYNKMDLLSIVKSAGFRTAWLSNQNATGIWDNVVSVAAREADFVKFHTSAYGKEFLRNQYDEVLLGSLQQQLDQSPAKQMVVVHTMVGHFPYCGLLPEDYRNKADEFDIKIDESVYGYGLRALDSNKDKENILKKYRDSVNCYDNTIIYIDFLLSNIIKQLEASDEPSVLVYFSDHGEAPLLNTGHESRMHSHFHVEIPLIMYANEAYRVKNTEKIQAIKANVTKPGSLVDLPYTLLGMLGIEGIGSDSNRDFASPAYEPFDRTTLHEKILYDQYSQDSDQVERTRGVLNALGLKYRDRVWAHRVDSLGAMMQARDVFSGVEMDITIKDELIVNHPPAKDVGLTLKTMLSMDDGVLKYWFDIKNLTNKNNLQALAELNRLDAEYNLKDRVLLETENLQAATVLTHSGWLVSYYLPTEEGLSALKSEDDMKEYALKAIDYISRNSIAAVSFDIRLKPIYTQFMSSYARTEKLEVFMWNHHLRSDDIRSVSVIKDNLDREEFDVLLVNFPSNFDR